MSDRARTGMSLQQTLPLLPVVVCCFPHEFAGSANAAVVSFSVESLQSQLAEFCAEFSKWFPRISYKYVLIPALLELILTIPLAAFLYLEFVREKDETPFDATDKRPERFRWLIVFCVTLTALVLLCVFGTLLAVANERVHAADRDAWSKMIPARDERAMSFMLLVVVNPPIYQLTAGLCMAIRSKRFLPIAVPMLTVGLLVYAVLLTTFFCLFDRGPFDDLIFGRVGKKRTFAGGSAPEVALWITGVAGVAFMWMMMWPARKLLVTRKRDSD